MGRAVGGGPVEASRALTPPALMQAVTLPLSAKAHACSRRRARTQAVKPVLGKYYREPAKSPGPIPVHLLAPLVRSFKNDHYVEDTGDIVFYKRDPAFGRPQPAK